MNNTTYKIILLPKPQHVLTNQYRSSCGTADLDDWKENEYNQRNGVASKPSCVSHDNSRDHLKCLASYVAGYNDNITTISIKQISHTKGGLYWIWNQLWRRSAAIAFRVMLPQKLLVLRGFGPTNLVLAVSWIWAFDIMKSWATKQRLNFEFSKHTLTIDQLDLAHNSFNLLKSMMSLCKISDADIQFAYTSV